MRWPKFKKFWTKTEEELPVDESEKQEEQYNGPMNSDQL